MSVSYNLLLALLLLAPGFGVYAGIYLGSQTGRIQFPPPAPGSVFTLAIVTIGSVAAHLVGVLIFAAEERICAITSACIATHWEPNAYRVLLVASQPNGARGPEQIAAVLMVLVVLTALAFVLAYLVTEGLTRLKTFRGLIYGWLAETAVAEDRNEIVVAYILSDVEAEGTTVGYSGAIHNLKINADKEITTIVLSDCEVFYLRVDKRGVRQYDAAGYEVLSRLYLERARIKNINFERVRIGP